MVPENEFDAIQKKSKVKAAVSPNTMQNNLYSSLSQVCDDVSYVSYPAVATWPKGGVFATWPKKLMLKDRLGVNRIFMVNLPVLKQITVFFSVFLSLLTWVLQHRDKQKYIMTYADFAEYCLPAIIISRIFRFPVCLFLTELPGHAHYLAGKKRIKDRILILSEIYKRSLYDKYDGFVFVSACSAKVVPVGLHPWTVVEGFAEEALICDSGSIEKETVPTAMYAGSLGEAYNIPMLCDAFRAVKGDYRLWICGDGKYRDYVQESAKKDKRIIYLGRVSRESVIEHERRCHLLIHAKNANDEHSQYAFSSKILEYMASGTPVLTTKVEGVPQEYYDHAFVVDGGGATALTEALQQTLALSLEELDEKGAMAQNFLLNEKNQLTQGKKILKVMRAAVESI